MRNNAAFGGYYYCHCEEAEGRRGNQLVSGLL